MTFHIWVDGGYTARGVALDLHAMNLDEETLQERFLDPYRAGRAITWDGKSVPGGAIEGIRVYETEAPLGDGVLRQHGWRAAIEQGREITNEVITGPPGAAVVTEPAETDPGVERDPRRVMVVHGRNSAALDAMATFLRSLGLEPILWEDAVEETGLGSPHNLEAVEAAMKVAQAVVVIFTAEDEAQVMSQFRDPGVPEEGQLQGQPRPNVFLEAGMAMGLDRRGTILTWLGNFRGASDVDGLNAVRLDNSAQRRAALRKRLRTAGCAVDERDHYLNPAQAGDFEAALVASVSTHTQRSVEPPPTSGIDVRQKLRLMGFELGSIKQMLTEAKKVGFYSPSARLPADEWYRSHEELSKHPELDRVLDAAKLAYERADQFNLRVGPRLSEDLTVLEEDPIDEVLRAVSAAEAHLRSEISRRTPS